MAAWSLSTRVAGAILAAILIGVIGVGVWWAVARSGDESTGPNPSPSPTESLEGVPGVPRADREFRVLEETYPSAWKALGLESETISADPWQVRGPDGSVLIVDSSETEGSRIGLSTPDGATTWLTDWLPTDVGQQWGAVAFSDPWLVYSDDAGSHDDGPITAPGVFLANIDSGDIVVLGERDYGAPYTPCEECGDWMFFTEAAIGTDAVYWTEGGPRDSFNDRPIRSFSFQGGEVETLLTGGVHFDDPSCVTTPGAEVRVSGAPEEAGENLDNRTYVWDLGPGSATLVSPPQGLDGGANNVSPSTCAGVEVKAWMTRLDGEPWDGTITKWSEDDPNVLLVAIDFVGSEGRARVRIDDDTALFSVTSRIDGWAVIELQAAEVPDDRFLLFDTDAWALYEIDAPEGSVLIRAEVSQGRMNAYVDTDLTQDWYSADTLLSAVLP